MRTDRTRWLLTLALATLPLLGFWLYGLFDIDEGYYAAVASEMNRRGEWITPLYNGQPWYEKPILLYWLAKPTIAIFGEMLGPRLPSALCAVGTLALIGWYGRRRLTPLSGQIAMLVLGSSLLFVAVGRMMLTDMPLVLALSAGFLLFWESLVGDARWRILAFACLGAAVLAKGPVALVLFAPAAVYALWLLRRAQPEIQRRPWWVWPASVVAMLAVIALWYVPAYLKDGQVFVQGFLIEQNWERFLGGDPAHTLTGFADWIFYIPILIVGFAPWWWHLPKAWPRPDSGDERLDLRRFLAAWALIVFVFFTLSGAKLPHYILPMFPPMALLVGHQLAMRLKRQDRPAPVAVLRGAAMWTVFMAILANVVFMTYYGLSGHAEVHALARLIRDQEPREVAIFQLSRRDRDLGTGQLRIRETTHPSLLHYLNRNVLDTEELDALAQAPRPIWVITRRNRLAAEDKQLLDAQGVEIEDRTPPGFESYRLYLLR
jgi:4-amino-4-deoxy-L-arabinose transferase-like glycosyltransferase